MPMEYYANWSLWQRPTTPLKVPSFIFCCGRATAPYSLWICWDFVILPIDFASVIIGRLKNKKGVVALVSGYSRWGMIQELRGNIRRGGLIHYSLLLLPSAVQPRNAFANF